MDDINWQRPEASNSTGNCPELADGGDCVLFRNSTAPETVVTLTKAETWCLIDGIKRGEFDHLIAGVVVERTA